jgi:hypothetical protein
VGDRARTEAEAKGAPQGASVTRVRKAASPRNGASKRSAGPRWLKRSPGHGTSRHG